MLLFHHEKIHTILLDMDAVLVDLEGELGIINNIPNIQETLDFTNIIGIRKKIFFDLLFKSIDKKCFENAKPLPLYYEIMQLIPYWQSLNIKVEILSSTTSNPEYQNKIATQKLKWVKTYGLDNIKLNLVQGGVKKQTYAKPGVLLLDDSIDNIRGFMSQNGYGIVVTKDVNKTLYQLQLLNLVP